MKIAGGSPTPNHTIANGIHAIGVAWMVVVVAEMVAVRSGLGFLIIDARNGLRMDLVVCGMITIGVIGIGLDILFARLAKVPSVRWGFER